MTRQTTCPTCRRRVGVAPNWEKRQAGRLVNEYRTSRHAATPRPSSSRDRTSPRPICPGSNVLVDGAQVQTA